jgi:hypothetical protein
MRLKRLWPAAFLAFLFPLSAGAGVIGVFTEVEGEVQLLRGENYLAAASGVEVEQQDIVETSAGATAQLDMEDGSVFKLGPETRLVLSDYQLDGDRNVVSAGLDVLAGWVRFAVSKLRGAGSYAFRTPVMTVGVRGTEGVIEAESESGGLHLEEGEVEIAGAGDDAGAFVAERVTAGQFVQRQRGQRFQRLDRPPPEFARRLPPVVRHKLERRAQELRRRGVPPRVIRRMTREDAQRFLQRHPHAHERVRERFRPLGMKQPPGVPPARPGPRPGGPAGPAVRAPGQREKLKDRERPEAVRDDGENQEAPPRKRPPERPADMPLRPGPGPGLR